MAAAGVAPAAAGSSELVWVTDSEPGIRRQRKAGAFVYVTPQGRPLRDAAVLQRIRSLAIPPAYEDVWICTRDDGHLQATGRDARGRKQYRYHPHWHAQRGDTKFGRMREFGRLLPRLRALVLARLDSTAEPTRERVLATLVRLLDTTWLRIGNDEYARSNGSYGLSTLRCSHAGVRGQELRLSFVGKSGVRHEVRLTDRRIVGVVRRCRELPGQELFQYQAEDGTVGRLGSTDVNAWLSAAAGGTRVTAKDFRTWHGSVQALVLTLAACASESPPSPAQIVTEVARRLGNTAAVCRKSYIHPQVLALSDCLTTAESRAELLSARWVRQPPMQRGLAVGERQLLGLLKQRRPRGAAG